MQNPLWSETLLEEMRQVGDPQADAVVAAVIDRHDVERVNEMMASIVRNDELVPADMPAIVRDYLDQPGWLPEWADRDLIRHGERFFNLHWPNIVTLLFCASLPSAYAAHRGAQVLFLTKRMTGQVHRRIFETAQFILDVMAPGGLDPAGNGIRAAQKVRLLHASIRHLILHKPRWRERWDPAWGLPINQTDMAGTLMTFSVQILLGMRRFRLPLEPADEEAYLHAWKVVGHMMGVRPELLPADVADAQKLAMAIFEREKGSSEAGTALTAALLDFMQRQTPGRLYDGLPAAIIRQSIDSDVADLLGVPPANWTRLLFDVEESILRTADRFNLAHPRSRLLQRFSFGLVSELVKIERGGNRSLFTIPATLRAPI